MKMHTGYTGNRVQNRQIFISLVKRNLFGNYRSSYIGFGWHFFTPLLMLLVYYIAFSELRSSTIQDYWIFLASALFPFNFMLTNLTGGTASVTSNSSMIKKISFPRELIPLSYVVSTLIATTLGYCAILLVILVSGFGLTITVGLLPFCLFINTLFVIGYVLLFSSVNVYVRDLQHLISATNMIFIFTTPVYYMLSSTSGILKMVSLANPMTYYVELYHEVIYYGNVPAMEQWFWALTIALASLVIGILVFSVLKNNFADRL